MVNNDLDIVCFIELYRPLCEVSRT